VTELTDSGGVVAKAYIYDSFGQIVDQTGTLTNPYTYTGREVDQETGLYYYRARTYDSRLGRFLEEDLLDFSSGDTNFYLYVNNRPLNLVDPNGKRGISVLLCAVADIVLNGIVTGKQLSNLLEESLMIQKERDRLAGLLCEVDDPGLLLRIDRVDREFRSEQIRLGLQRTIAIAKGVTFTGFGLAICKLAASPALP